MQRRQHVLTIGFGTRHEVLASRLLLVSVRAVPAKSAEEALQALELSEEPIGAALVPPEHPFDDLARDLRRLRAAAREVTLRFIAIGAHPEPRRIAALRRAGVEFALWEPYEDGELRFVVNAALRGSEEEMRRSRRVPTGMVARVLAGAGEKSTIIYDLSVGGAFLETHRPSMRGSRIRVELPLPAGTEVLEARVVSNNVPGNLRRANLPLGMGVQFLNLDAPKRRALEEYVEEKARDVRL